MDRLALPGRVERGLTSGTDGASNNVIYLTSGRQNPPPEKRILN